MPNHDGTGPAKGCCNQEGRKQAGCGCQNRERNHAENAGCCQGGEKHRHHGEHAEHANCCKKQSEQ